MDHSPATRSGHPHHILPPDNREAWQKALHVPERSQESALPQGFCFALEAQNVERVFHRLDNLRVNVGAAKLAGGAHTLAVLKHRAVPAQAKPCPAFERSGSAAETGTTLRFSPAAPLCKSGDVRAGLLQMLLSYKPSFCSGHLWRDPCELRRPRLSVDPSDATKETACIPSSWNGTPQPWRRNLKLYQHIHKHFDLHLNLHLYFARQTFIALVELSRETDQEETPRFIESGSDLSSTSRALDDVTNEAILSGFSAVDERHGERSFVTAMGHDTLSVRLPSINPLARLPPAAERAP